MAVNVTQKDKTLSEVIRHCEETADVWATMPGDFSSGYRKAMTDVAAYCRKRLGYSGSMPLEVPNQSEQVHNMSTRDEDEARSHINVQKQLRKE